MRFQVRCMRKRGHRMDLKQIENLPALTGEVRTQYVERDGSRYLVANLLDPNQPAQGPLLVLYEPILFNIAPNAMGLRGFEAGGHVQEWHMEAVR